MNKFMAIEIYSQGERKKSLVNRIVSTSKKLATVTGCLTMGGLIFNPPCSIVRGSSMEPTIHDGDTVILDGLPGLKSRISNGDIVTFRPPVEGIDKQYVKRISMVFGDINSGEGYSLNEGEYWVLGDNRNRSSDSRYFGPVKDLTGKVIATYCPHEGSFGNLKIPSRDYVYASE